MPIYDPMMETLMGWFIWCSLIITCKQSPISLGLKPPCQLLPSLIIFGSIRFGSILMPHPCERRSIPRKGLWISALTSWKRTWNPFLMLRGERSSSSTFYAYFYSIYLIFVFVRYSDVLTFKLFYFSWFFDWWWFWGTLWIFFGK